MKSYQLNQIISSFLLMLLTAFSFTNLNAQDIAISEIRSDTGSTVTVEITNFDSIFAEDISEYYLYNFPERSQLSELEILCGNLDLGPGESVTITGFGNTNSFDGELGLFETNVFNDSTLIVSYVLWGTNLNQQSLQVAIDAGLWTSNDAVPSFNEGWSIVYDGSGNMSSDWAVTSLPSICGDVMCSVNGGEISYSGETEICGGGGDSDVLNVGLTNETGANSIFAITDNSNIVIALSEDSIIGFDQLAIGANRIWHISYDEDLLTGLEIGADLDSDLVGCFHLSNSISIDRLEVDGGLMRTSDDLTICTGERLRDFVFPIVSGAFGESQYVITDTANEVLVLPSTGDFPIDFSTYEDGFYEFWHIGYTGTLTGLEIGANIRTDLVGCYDLSNPLEVVKLQPYAGRLSVDGSKNLCLTRDNNDVSIEIDSSVGLNQMWIATGLDFTVLDTFSGDNVDFTAIDNDEYWIWNVAFMDSLANLVVGELLNVGGFCEAISDSIHVTRSSLYVGTISTDIVQDYCSNSSYPETIEFSIDSVDGAVQSWLVLDEEMRISEIFDTNVITIVDSIVGTNAFTVVLCNYDAVPDGLEIDSLLSGLDGCFSLSNAITFTKQSPMGGSLSLMFEEDSSICISSGAGKVLDIILEGEQSGEQRYILTDESNIIRSIQDGELLLESSLNGRFNLQSINYLSGLEGLEVGNSIDTSLNGCFDLSNQIGLNISSVIAGQIMAIDTSLCADDSVGVDYEISVSGQQGEIGLWLITDSSGMIQSVVDSSTFRILDSYPRSYMVWHVSGVEESRDLFQIGELLAEISGSCFALSEPVSVTLDTGQNGACVITSVINTFGGDVEIAAYPNPFTTNLTVQLAGIPEELLNGGLRLSVFDVLGRNVFNQALTREVGNEEKLEITTSDWPAGNYFIHLRSGNQIFSSTVIKVN